MKINNFFEPNELERKVKRTKIITTIGPSTSKKEDILKLFESGMNTIRLNFSHGSGDEQLDKIVKCREIIKELRKPISIMLDTKGPEIRVGKMKDGKQTIKAGNEIIIYTHDNEYKNRECGLNELTVSYDMSVDLKSGDMVLVDDGKLELTVIKVEPQIVTCKAFNTHEIKTNKRVNLPGVDFSLPFLAEKDKLDIAFAAEQKLDYIAASFVNTAKNVQDIREILKKHNGEHIQIISKIESKIGIYNIDEIVDASDGIMVARGDLGLEIPYYEVPYWEKVIIRKCREKGKIVIVATQMLESMTDNPSPTRAEVTDVYVATEMGADATMLSGESAAGLYPFITTKTMGTINKRAERVFYSKTYYKKALSIARECTQGIRADIAYDLAIKTEDGAYEFAIALSRTGELLKTISKFRPNVTILGVTESEQLWTAFGAWHSIFMNKVDSIKDFRESEIDQQVLVKSWGAKPGDKVVLVDSHNMKEFIVR